MVAYSLCCDTLLYRSPAAVSSSRGAAVLAEKEGQKTKMTQNELLNKC